MMPRIKNIVVTVMLLSALPMAGCIKEDTSGCDRGLYIRFIPENPKHVYAELVRTVDLYFYDNGGGLAAKYHYTKDGLREGDRAARVDNLAPGKYTLVGVINDLESYRTVDAEQLSTLRSYLNDVSVKEKLVDFFSGLMEITVRDEDSQQEDLPVFKHNNDIRLVVLFDGFELQPGETLESRIAGNNGMYHYSSWSASENIYTTYTAYRVEKNDAGIPVVFDYTVMRLWRTCDLTLYLSETGPAGRGTELNIADELADIIDDNGQHPYDNDQKLRFNDEYRIEVTLGPDFVVLSITVNDWSSIGGGVEV